MSKFFSFSEGYWLRLQNAYDLMEAHRQFDGKIKKIVAYSLNHRG